MTVDLPVCHRSHTCLLPPTTCPLQSCLFSCGKKLPHLLLRRKVATKTAELESKPARKQGEILRSIVDHATRSPPCQPCRHRGTASLLPAATRAAVAEFIATSIFVFAAEGSIYSLWKLYTDTETPGGLLAVAIAHALALSAAVAVASDASGGHVNPAVTFGVLVGRRISFGSAALYWAAQLLGAVAAALLLRLVSGGTRPMGFGLGGGPFDGAALNPARAFGPALVGSSWRHHWVCWVGPLIGASLAGALYEFVVIEQQPEAQGATAAAPRMPLAAEDY